MSAGDDPWPGATGPAEDRRCYRIEDCRDVRRGGLGIVYRAVLAAPRRGLPAGTQVGLKMLTGLDAERYAKLSGRSAALSEVRHPHLATHVECFVGAPPSLSIVDAEDSRERFASHVWIDGTSLSDLVAAGRTTPTELVRWTRELARALDFLHEHPAGPFAHRDVHPRNIIVRDDGGAVLIDFDTVLWTDALDTHLVSFTGFAPARVANGLREAQQGDRWSLVLVLLRGLAGDLEGVLTDEEVDRRAEMALAGLVPRPAASVRRARQLLAESPSRSAVWQIESILRPGTYASRAGAGDKRVRQAVPAALLVASLSLAAAGAATAAVDRSGRPRGTAALVADAALARVPAAARPVVRARTVPPSASSRPQAAAASSSRGPSPSASPSPSDSASPSPSLSQSPSPSRSPSLTPSSSRFPTSGPTAPRAARVTPPAPSTPSAAASTPSAAAKTPSAKAATVVPPDVPAPTSAPASPSPSPTGTVVGVTEVAFRETHTWSDYTTVSGSQSAVVPSFTAVEVSCRVTGFAESDGNDWWYRLASPPWSGAYYATADAFYNNGASQGPTTGTPYVDRAVPAC